MSHKFIPFLTGYADGERSGTFCSIAEAEDQHPGWTDQQITSYLNGRDDGVAGEDWRKRRMLAEIERRAS